MKNSIQTFITILLMLSAFSVSYAQDAVEMMPENLIFLDKLDGDNLTLQVSVCPETALTRAEIKFTVSEKRPTEYAKAEIQIMVPKKQCLAASTKKIELNLKELIQSEAKRQGIVSQFIYLTSLPTHVEVWQMDSKK